MKSDSLRFRWSLLVVAVCLLGFVQPTNAREESSNNFHIRLLAWNEHQPHDLYVQTDATSFERLDLRSNRRSSRYDLMASRVVQIFRDGTDAEGNPVKIPVSHIEVPESITDPLVILFNRTTDGETDYVGMVVEDKKESFPFGSYRLINFTDVPVIFELDGFVERLSPRDAVLMKPKSDKRGNIPVRLFTRNNSEPKLVRQTFWRHEPDQRMLVFILTSLDSQRGDLVLRTIAEREEVYRRGRTE